MSKSRRSRNAGSARRGAPRPEIGSFVEAVEFGLAEAHPRALALCRQAHRALEAAFSELGPQIAQRTQEAGTHENAETESEKEGIETLTLLEVVPDPTIRRLRVWLGAPRSAKAIERDVWMEQLFLRRGFFRARVAEAIHRKRAPHLVFEVVFPFESGTERRDERTSGSNHAKGDKDDGVEKDGHP